MTLQTGGLLTADCHNRNNILANRSQMDYGMPTTTRQYTDECQLLGKISGPALKFSAECHKPRDRLKPLAFRGTHLSAELGKKTEFQLPPFYIESPPV
jgi:hypothetical protein